MTSRAAARSLYFSDLSGPERKRLRAALMLIGEDARDALRGARRQGAKPFPRADEEAAVDKLRQALQVMRGSRKPRAKEPGQ
jgi:hypothetical protein